MNAFWESALLNNFADECIYHVIIPTLMYTTIPAELPDCGNDDDMLCAQQANTRCVRCDTSVAGTCVVVAVRLVIAKRVGRKMPDDGTVAYIYRCGFGSASICEACCVAEKLSTSAINADHAMIEEMYETLETIAVNVGHGNIYVDLTGSEICALILASFDAHHASAMKKIGKKDAACAYCKRRAPALKFCSACHLLRYCDTTCSHADWPRHKAQCAFIKSRSLFSRTYEEKRIK